MQKITEYAGVSFESMVSDAPAFGIIKLNAVQEFNKPLRKINMQFYVDNSGSMSDICGDGRTKMQHVNFSVSQIIRKACDGATSLVNVDIKTFDDSIVPVISTPLNSETVEEIVTKVNKIFPTGGTDIYSVLKLEASLQEEKEEETDRVFILLSDGQDMTHLGRDALIQMAAQINPVTHVIMIGVGDDHDSVLFKSIINNRTTGHYTPVSNVENISIAMSELVYGILNKILKRPTITVTNGEIYSWSMNKWTNCIKIDDIVTGRKKTFNVRSATPLQFTATLDGIAIDGSKFVLDILEVHYDVVLTYDRYRHKTMELLGESVTAGSMNFSEIKGLKTRLKNMMVELKAYMDQNNLRGDKGYQVLCDDIFTCHQTIGSAHGIMYAGARQTSQGSQSIYTNQAADLSRMAMPRMMRGITCGISQMMEEDDLPPMLPPSMMRGVNYCIQTMQQEHEAIQHMEGVCEEVEEKEEDDVYKLDEDEDDVVNDPMLNHKMLASDDSPYSNPTEIAFIRKI